MKSNIDIVYGNFGKVVRLGDFAFLFLFAVADKLLDLGYNVGNHIYNAVDRRLVAVNGNQLYFALIYREERDRLNCNAGAGTAAEAVLRRSSL